MSTQPPRLSITTLAGLLIATGMIISVGGCVGAGPKDSSSLWRMPWTKKDKPPEPYPNPVKMAVTWTADTLVQSGHTPTRGFGGRLFFYDEKTRAVPVEGDLTIHAFAEQSDGSVGEVKRYHYTAEQFTQHFSRTDLGASYSVWIPWDAVGGDQMRVSLVPSFRSASGKLVQGETALVGLPGRRNKVENIAKRPDPAQLLMSSRDPSKSGLTTTTIPVRGGAPTVNQRPGLTAAAEAIATARAQGSQPSTEGSQPSPPATPIATAFTPSPFTPAGFESPVAADATGSAGSTDITNMPGLPGASEAGAPEAASRTATRPLRLGQTVTPASAAAEVSPVSPAADRDRSKSGYRSSIR